MYVQIHLFKFVFQLFIYEKVAPICEFVINKSASRLVQYNFELDQIWLCVTDYT